MSEQMEKCMQNSLFEEGLRYTADQLCEVIERFEQLEMEKKEIDDAQKELMDQAKELGFKTAAIHKVIEVRKGNPDVFVEPIEVIKVYAGALVIQMEMEMEMEMES